MQSGGGSGRNPGVGRAVTSSAAASPTSSSSASQLGLDSMQQQQQQQMGSRQSFQQQLLRKPEGNEAFLAYQAGLQGVFGSNSFSSPSAMQLPQQSRKLHLGSNQETQLRGQGIEQQMLNPVHQAYLQYAIQAAQQKSTLGIQSQQQTKMGMLNSASLKEQEMRMGNLKMQEIMSMQAANQSQGSSSRNSSELVARGDKQMEQGQQIAPDQKSEGKPSTQGPTIGHLIPGNMIRPPMQAPETQQGIQNVVNTQIAVSAQLQAMQAWARERNIDLSHPANAHLMAQLIPLMQSRMVSQSKVNESNIGTQSSPVPVSKQQVTSPAVASESSAHANSSSDMSGQSGSSKLWTLLVLFLWATTNHNHWWLVKSL